MNIAYLIQNFSSIVLSTAEAAPGGAKVGVKAGVLDGVINAGPMVQLLLFVLLALSVTSWAIIFTKFKQFKSFKEANSLFIERFWKASSLEAVAERIQDYPNSNLARVFKAAFLELQRLADSASSGPGARNSLQHAESSGQQTPTRLDGLDNLERALRKAIDEEVALGESRLNFLATTGSTSPFVGLLGTVVGIMTSFGNIAATGSASLAVVAPGISEALFSTAIGLFAALPAVAGYNYFVSQLKRIEMDLNSFGSDFLNIAKRNFFRAD